MSELGATLTGLAGTFLGDMDEASLERALEGASLCNFRSGDRIFADAFEPRIGIVIDGIARSYIVGSDGRQLTLRYIRSPALLTTASTAIAINPIPISNQAVTDVTVLELDQPVLVELFAQDTRVAFAWANELSRRLTDVYRSFAATFFGSFAER